MIFGALFQVHKVDNDKNVKNKIGKKNNPILMLICWEGGIKVSSLFSDGHIANFEMIMCKEKCTEGLWVKMFIL